MEITNVKATDGYTSEKAVSSVANVQTVTKVDKAVKAQDDNGSQVKEKTAPSISEKELKGITEAMNEFMSTMNPDLKFAVHDKTKQLMVRMVDAKQDKVIKEFPSHDFLDMVAKIRDYVGSILDKKV